MRSAYDMVVLANRLIPMDQLLDWLNVEYFGVPGAVRCPIHNPHEANPSARIYEDRKSLYCFACTKTFYPVDVAAHMLAADRGDAAEKILEVWGIDVDDPMFDEQLVSEKQERLSDTTFSKFVEAVEQKLKEWSGKIPLDQFQGLAKRTNEWYAHLKALPEEKRYAEVKYFSRIIDMEADRYIRSRQSSVFEAERDVERVDGSNPPIPDHQLGAT